MRTSQLLKALAWLALATATASACSDTPAGPVLPALETVRVSYCPGLEPTWVAFQDGDGPWTRVSPTPEGGNVTFEYAFREHHGGIATLTPVGGGSNALLVLYGVPMELATAGDTNSIHCGGFASKTILGTVLGLDTGELAVVNGHFSRAIATAAAGGTFALTGLGVGPHDLIATRWARSNGRTDVTGVILRRDVVLPDSATAPAFDFASTERFPPSTAVLSLSDIGPGGASVAVRIVTGTTEAMISPPAEPSQDLVRPYVALPADRLRPGDLQVLSASGVDGAASRGSDVYFRSPVDRALALPARLVRPTFDTIAATPVLRLQARFEPQPDYDRGASIAYLQGATAFVAVSMTAAYAALTEEGYALVVPDLSTAAGFNPGWALRPGERIRWIASRIGGTVGFGPAPQVVDGSIRRIAIDSDTIPGS